MGKLTQRFVTKTLANRLLTRVDTMNHRSVVQAESVDPNSTSLPGAIAQHDSEGSNSPNDPAPVEAIEDDAISNESASKNNDRFANVATANGRIEVLTEKLDGRRRQITATVQIPHSIENVWSILTDYERLSDFIPSLKSSRRIDHPNDGIRIEQIGSESLLKVKFCARVVLDMFESFPHCVGFEMVEGDFKMFCGEWQLQPISDGNFTELTYVLRVWPSRLIPVGMIEKRLSQGLQVNLIAIKQRADELFG